MSAPLFHILIQHRHQPDEICGVLIYIQYLKIELERLGHTVSIVSTRQESLANWIHKIQQADIVHMNSNQFLFACLCKLFFKKVVIKYHYPFYQSIHTHYEKAKFWQRLKSDFLASLPKKNYPLKWKLYTVVKWSKLATRFGTALLADSHVACSHFLAESLSFPWPVITIYNPIAVEVSQSKLRKSLDKLSYPYSFVYVGRVCADKGVDLLVKAANLLKQKDKEFRLQIVGDGELLPICQELVNTLKIQDKVEFCGRKSHAEVLAVIGQAIALVTPSRWQDPAPYVVLEAGSQQTCAIVSQVGGLPEVGGSSCLSFPSEDIDALAAAMQTCLDDPENSIARGNQHMEHILQNFSPNVTVAQFVKLCQQLLASQDKAR